MAPADLQVLKPTNDRWILSCDGGGIRGIITLRCLQALEQHLGKPCVELFDMFAGTSTGAIIAGGLAAGRAVQELIELYTERRDEIFSRSFWSYPFGRLATKYRKEPVHRLLCEEFGNRPLADCCNDIMITATDTVLSKTIFFTSFRQPDGGLHGNFFNLPLRHVIEASMSAPTYFPPHGRFIDGGVGIHNNPCYAAAIEALFWSFPVDPVNPASPVNARYRPGKIVVFSFGAGSVSNIMEPGDAMKKRNLGWIDYVIGEGMDQANLQQSALTQSHLDGYQKLVVFYRYQIHLRNDDSTREHLERYILQEPIENDFNLQDLTLDSIDQDSYSFLDRVGIGFGSHLRTNNFWLKHPTLTASPLPASMFRGSREEYPRERPDLDPDYQEKVYNDEFHELDEVYGGCE